MAAPYLYETIIIGRQRTLISLCITLMHSENKGENPSSGSHPLGWYTKRLDFAARDSGDMFLNSLAEAIRYLPNLTMFNFNPHGYVSSSLYSTFSSVARALADTCGLNLRQLNFSRHCLQESDWQVLLSSTPNLLAFHSTDTLAGIPLLRDSAAAQLTNLRSLIILPEHGHMRPWRHTHSFSDLRHLELASCEAANQLSVKTTPIPVRALYLHIRRRYDYPGQWPDIEKHFPNVSRLSFFLDEWNALPLEVPPPVTHLALHCRRPQAKSGTFSYVFRVLTTLKSSRLKVVRFADRRVGEELRTRHPAILEEGLRRIRLACSFVLEDYEGRPF
ncbi:hypothetical protein HWV62_16440 [Athelia sp. TMB]|nr:hypothetical protein HWV62_16440 [Athelia sp. TMB]